MGTIAVIGIVIGGIFFLVVSILAFLMPIYVYQLRNRIKITNHLLEEILKSNAHIARKMPDLTYLCDLTFQQNCKLDRITGEVEE